MKNIIISLIAIMTLFTVSAQDKSMKPSPVKDEDVPLVVMESIKANFPEAVYSELGMVPIKLSNKLWNININEKSRGSKIDLYQIKVQKEKNHFYVLMDETGNILRTKETLTDIDLPEIILNDLAKNFFGWELINNHEVIKMRNKKEIAYYKVRLSKGMENKSLFYDLNGRLFKENTEK